MNKCFRCNGEMLVSIEGQCWYCAMGIPKPKGQPIRHVLYERECVLGAGIIWLDGHWIDITNEGDNGKSRFRFVWAR